MKRDWGCAGAIPLSLRVEETLNNQQINDQQKEARNKDETIKPNAVIDFVSFIYTCNPRPPRALQSK